MAVETFRARSHSLPDPAVRVPSDLHPDPPLSPDADPDLSAAVLDDLFRYPRKNPWIAWTLWLFTGFLGGHRFYLERVGTGVLMLFTSGGLFIWWLIDAARMNRMIQAFNEDQAQRERLGLPPAALDFMPAIDRADLSGPPAWAAARGGRMRLIGDAFVLLVAGAALGSVSASTGNLEGIFAVLVLIVVTNLGARWNRLAQRPVLRALDRWSHRLRIYYYLNDPGSPLALLFRPLVGPVTAFFRKRALAEVRLYLQLGASFVVAFSLIDIGQALAEGTGGWGGTLSALGRDMVLTFVIIYGFASPIGATLTTHILLSRRDRVVWVLSGITVGALLLGLLGG